MPELELLDPQHLVAETPGRPVGGGAPDTTETEDDQPMLAHIRSSR
jgi:hypothetical protein